MVQRIRDDLRALVEPGTGARVTITLFTHRQSAKAGEDRLRFKNLVREAERQLAERGVPSLTQRTLLAEAYRLEADEHAWVAAEDGLAVLCALDLTRTYRVPVALPERVVVNERFYVKPLLRLLSEENEFFLLGLSANETRLFRANPFSMVEVPLPGFPASLKELQSVEQHHVELQARSTSGSRQGAAMFHGHGDEGDFRREAMLEFFRHVNRKVTTALQGESAPLVLACVEEHVQLYTQANSYSGLQARFVKGNPEHIPAAELRRAAWEVVRPVFEAERNSALAEFGEHLARGRASTAPDEIVPAAVQGRVARLFLERDAMLLGRYDEATGKVRVGEAPGAEDLLDLSAAHTMANSGSVDLLDPGKVPGGGLLAAIFRY